jgi:hypothetical protein
MGLEQGELHQIKLRAAAADAFELADNWLERIDRRGEIPPLERGEAAGDRRDEAAGRVAAFSPQLADFPHPRIQRRAATGHDLGQHGVHVGECDTGVRERAGRQRMQRAPPLGVARLASEFATPQERDAVVHLPARRPAMDIRGEGFLEQPVRRRHVAHFQLAHRAMPAQMAVERRVARIGWQPARQEFAPAIRIALLVAEMRAGVRRPGIFRVLGERALDLRASGVALAVLRQRHAVMRREPPIVAVARRQFVEQVEQHPLLPGPAGAADQPVGESGGGQHHDVARPGVEMPGQGGERRLAVAQHQRADIVDVTGLAVGHARAEVIGGDDRRERARPVAALQQRVRLRGIGKGEAGIGGECPVERLDRAGIHRPLFLAALDIGVTRRGRGGGKRQFVLIRQHR